MHANTSKKIALFLMIGFLAVWLAMTDWVLTRVKQNAQAEVETSLTTVLDISSQAMESWSKQLKISTDFIANKSSEFHELAHELILLYNAGKDIKKHPIQRKVRQFMTPIMHSQNLRGFFIISKDFINLSSSRDSNIGTRSLITEQEYIKAKVMGGNVTIGLPQLSDVPLVDKHGVLREKLPTMFVYAPIFYHDSNEVEAILAFRIDPSEDFTAILQRGRIGETGETYAVDSSARLLSDSRFDDQLIEVGFIKEDESPIVIIKVFDPNTSKLTVMAEKVISDLNYTQLKGYNDYRGVKVIGTARWLSDLDMGIISEIDEKEAYNTLRTYQATIWIAAVFVFLLVISLYALFMRFNRSLEIQVEQRTQEFHEQVKLKELEQEKRIEHESRSSLLLESISEGVFFLDKKGLCTFINPAAEKMLGYGTDELIGKSVHNMIHHSYSDGSHYPSKKCFMRDSYTTGASHHITDEVFWREDQSSFPVEYYATPVEKDGEIIGSVVIFSDITERQTNDKMKDEFISTVSHELRTPLTSIKGSLQLVEGGVLGEVDPKVADILSVASRNSDRLLLLINEILDLSKIEQGKMKLYPESLNLEKFLKGAIESNQAYATQQKVTLQLGMVNNDIKIKGDENRLNQVMSNLISNASKFSHSGGVVTLQTEIQGDKIQISVIDKGVGIPDSFHDKIFEKFTQNDSSDTRKVGGTGLGLSISKAIVELHEGKIGFKSKPGQGTRFYFTLPIEK